ncbi:fluoride efflux transporter CrcB [Emcibacter sp. SYSU 3D8]|uniref:fluoride efflux transporter CrcB n=1 Tax=Emcibacter sp. SYSU 3D8 TaxID=3133969 RepID=UPI0031FE526B
MSYFMVFLGAGIGGAMRHGVNLAVTRGLGIQFPFGIMLINVLGCLSMGLIVGWLALRGQAGQEWRLFLTTGVLGGFTTFSAFSLDAALLYERGEPGLAAVYVLGSVVLSLAAVFAGLWAVRQIG